MFIGESMPWRSRLTDEQKKLARELREKGLGYAEIAEMVGATYMQIRYLLDEEFRERMKNTAKEWIRKNKDLINKRMKIKRHLLTIKRYVEELAGSEAWAQVKQIIIENARDEEVASIAKRF